MVLLMETAVSKQYDFVLDLDKGYQSETLSIIQASNNVRKFKVRLTKEGLPFDLTNCIVKAVYSKPDDTIVLNNVEIADIEDGCITVGLTEQCLSEEGRVRCEIVVIDVLNESFITFPMFSFKAKGSLFVGSGVESSTELQTLIEAITKVESFDDIADEIMLEIRNSLAQAQEIVTNMEEKLVEAIDTSSTQTATIEASVELAERSLKEILTHLDSVQQNVAELISLKNTTEASIRELKAEMQQTQQSVQSNAQKIAKTVTEVQNLCTQAGENKAEISHMRQDAQDDLEEMQLLQAELVEGLEATQSEALQCLNQIKVDSNTSESLVKKISERANNSNTWAASINDVLTNANNRYNEILKVKTNALNTVSDINYYGVLAELELGKITQYKEQGEQALSNMQKTFDAKMREFEDRFNELVSGKNAQ